MDTTSKHADWVSYSASKAFSAYNGTFLRAGIPHTVGELDCGAGEMDDDLFSSFCPREKCGGLIVEGNKVKRLGRLSIDMRRFQPSEAARTCVNLKSGDGSVAVREVKVCAIYHYVLLRRSMFVGITVCRLYFS